MNETDKPRAKVPRQSSGPPGTQDRGVGHPPLHWQYGDRGLVQTLRVRTDLNLELFVLIYVISVSFPKVKWE